MKNIKAGDVLTIMTFNYNEYEGTKHYKRKPTKVEVVGVYPWHVLVRNVQTKVKESFIWWDLQKFMVKKNG